MILALSRSYLGDAWTKEPGVRIDSGVCDDAADRALCPDVIPLRDGRLRMYFEGGSTCAVGSFVSCA